MHKILFLDTNDPAANLAHEESLFQNLQTDEEILLLYRNSPSVVVGTFQNPWLECDVDWLLEHGIPVLRRISGGGTVWHDSGNLNISFMGGRNRFKQKENLALLCNFLGNLGVNAEQNERGDLLAGDKKISGNAMCFRAEKVLHHATLLIDADLEKLRRALKVDTHGWQVTRSVGVRSKTSTVSKIVDLLPGANAEEFLSAFVEAIGKFFGVGIEHVTAEAQEPPQMESKYQSWEWNFGRTPEFQVRNSRGREFTVKNGTISGEDSQHLRFPGFGALGSRPEAGA